MLRPLNAPEGVFRRACSPNEVALSGEGRAAIPAVVAEPVLIPVAAAIPAGERGVIPAVGDATPVAGGSLVEAAAVGAPALIPAAVFLQDD